MGLKRWVFRKVGEKEAQKEKLEYEKAADKRYNDYLLHKILAKLDWLEWNCHPPVNYPLIIMVSIMTSVITTLVFTQL
ncbi:hypothetical protein FND36_10330 [Lachnospiraceae bacterium KGMB03038]|nr:hypothetical protein FND36_10330 [Lachnospiraceae bacterium KGMB03038]